MPRGDGAAEFRALTDAMDHHRPACRGDERYVLDDPTTEQKSEMDALCATCPLLEPCRTYATAAKPRGGHWPRRTRNARSPRTPRKDTDD